jgi:hypothetical protein
LVYGNITYSVLPPFSTCQNPLVKSSVLFLYSNISFKRPSLDPDTMTEVSESVGLPQKRFYRQRAHSNPIADHTFD